MWQMMDIIHHQGGGSGTSILDIPLAMLVPLETIEQNLHGYSAGQLLEIGRIYGHDAAHSVFIKNVYNGKAAETCLGR